MFRKQIRIKSHTQVKGSERKQIKDQVLKTFPTLTEANFDSILPKKEPLFNIKIVTASDEVVHLYVFQKVPMVFELKNFYYPTVYMLWRFPDLLPTFTTHPDVVPYLSSGADLMLPGVVVSSQEKNKYGNLAANALAAVNLTNNKASFAIGLTAQSSYDMDAARKRGKCLIILHQYRDKICDIDGIPDVTMPKLGPPEWLKVTNAAVDAGPSYLENSTNELHFSSTLEAGDGLSILQKHLYDDNNSANDMDDLLTYCFFVAIKYSKTLNLPVLTSNFYKLQMMPQCPEGKILDIKKSSFKKLKTFLDSMVKIGVITMSEQKKGVEMITSIDKKNEKYVEFYVQPSERPRKENDEITANSTTNIIESFVITNVVSPIFANTGLCKGSPVQMFEIRKYVTEYVKKTNCQDEHNKSIVRPNEELSKICKTTNPLLWEELFEKVCESMKSFYKVKSGTTSTVNKGKITPITFTISMRSGNKKVTIVDNLENFGIKLTEFAKECQHGAAASTSINKVSGKKSDQLLVQGNQILFLNSLLTEKYRIPPKYIRGLELAPKKK